MRQSIELSRVLRSALISILTELGLIEGVNHCLCHFESLFRFEYIFSKCN